MIDVIYNFLTQDGVYGSLRELITYLFQNLIRFTINLGNIFIEPLMNFVIGLFPFDLDLVGSSLSSAFVILQPYVSYIMDTIIIPKPVVVVIVSSIVFRILMSKNKIIISLLFKWYNNIKP